MPMIPISSPSASYPQNTTPARISLSSSLELMYGSCHRSAGITPRYASAATFTIARIASRSSSRQGRMLLMSPSQSQMIDAEKVYRQTTPFSRAIHERAVKVMPGGTTRTTTYFDPYPLYIERGAGCRVWDADGTERIDMLGNYSAMILGHAHPKVVEAINQQAARGTAFAAANTIEVELATLLCERVPSLDLVRFCNSGTEATMFAMRLARTFTGRPKIARIEGGYHGTHDSA